MCALFDDAISTFFGIQTIFCAKVPTGLLPLSFPSLNFQLGKNVSNMISSILFLACESDVPII